MIVVSDTTPLISLLKINRIDLLEKLFGDVLIPQAVFDELTADERFQLEANRIRQTKFIAVKPVNNPESASILKRATGLDQVTLVMKMEKESNDESAEKSADSKKMIAIDLSERQKQILAYMDAGVEYSTEQVAEKIGVKGPRTRQLLNELVNMELLACIGTTKRRRYIKV